VQSQTILNSKKWGLGVLFCGLVSVGVFLLLRPTNYTNLEAPQLARLRNASAVAIALLHYGADNGDRLPDHLSELVPKYISGRDVRFLFPVDRPPDADLDKASAAKLQERIDDEGAYTYMGAAGLGQDILLFERSNHWQGNWNDPRVVTVTSNFAPMLRSATDILSRVSSLHQPGSSK